MTYFGGLFKSLIPQESRNAFRYWHMRWRHKGDPGF